MWLCVFAKLQKRATCSPYSRKKSPRLAGGAELDTPFPLRAYLLQLNSHVLRIASFMYMLPGADGTIWGGTLQNPSVGLEVVKTAPASLPASSRQTTPCRGSEFAEQKQVAPRPANLGANLKNEKWH